ncbi:heme biosynthesis HemY N-terminal domain-containing protein [Glaciecola sp. KUL10]|uniref:heme biosynthesis HemY N-terminal domain-containing protein n=1 Tax=Glaciecola sp. (strain KUL10) TaxID=2161813 RepID=UPI000D781B0E|nr:heme biosynthesis HemY N-terminal domain-containing protein [Glaciecola sp. KUL10]
MRKLIVLLLLICLSLAALLLGHSMVDQKGYVLISFGETIIEMSVISALIILTVILVGLRIAEWGIKALAVFVLGSKRWFGVLSQRRQKKAMFDAINLLATGQLALAKKAIEKTFGGEFAGSNYILAADIERQLDNGSSVTRLLETAKTYKESEVAANIQLVNLKLSNKQYQDALSLLNELPSNLPKTKQLGSLWLTALAGVGQWDDFKEVLSNYKKPLGDDYIKWAQQATQGEFAEIASKQGAHALTERWNNLSRTAKKDIANQLVYIRLLIQQGMSQKAEDVILEYCGKKPKSEYFTVLRLLNHSSATRIISLVETWIKQDDKNAELYSVLAHIASNSGDKRLAEKAICKALEIRRDQEDAILYAGLLEEKRDFEQAALVYKNAV